MLDPKQYPALVLNADFSPLSLFPLETWAMTDAIHAVVKERVIVVEEYGRIVRSAKIEMPIPAVIALRQYVGLERKAPYNRLNLFVRDHGSCSYCGLKLSMDEMTVDHVLPRSRGGGTNYVNCTACCDRCNGQKGNRLPAEAGLGLRVRCHHPTLGELNRIARKLKLLHIERLAGQNPAWAPYLLAA